MKIRDPHYHMPGDTPDRLNFGRMARVVYGVARVAPTLAGGS